MLAPAIGSPLAPSVTWPHNSPVSHYTASYWYWWYDNFAAGDQTGIWKLEVEFEGETYEHHFRISDATGSGRVETRASSGRPDA